MPIATLTSKGKITLPKQVRAKLGLKPGDRLQVAVTPDDRLVMTLAVPLASLADILPKLQRPLSANEMNEAIAAAVSGKCDRRCAVDDPGYVASLPDFMAV
jgi:antitoxin PrlF